MLEAGDVILIEQQMCVCGRTCNAQCSGCGPVEWQQATFDAISLATAQGISVVEAAGNGAVQLDAPDCLGLFDRNVRDSGAIIVGAGDPFHANACRSRRTEAGSISRPGASSSPPPVTAICSIRRSASATPAASTAPPALRRSWRRRSLAVQGAQMAGGGDPLDPVSLRSLLTLTGDAQDECDPPASKIGAFPNLPAALGLTSCEDGLDNDGDGLIDGARSRLRGGLRDRAPVQRRLRQRRRRAHRPRRRRLHQRRRSERVVASRRRRAARRHRRPRGAAGRVQPAAARGSGERLPDRADARARGERRLRPRGCHPDGRLLGLDFASARVFEIDPASEGVAYLGGCAARAWGFASEAAGTIVFTDNAGRQRAALRSGVGSADDVTSHGSPPLPQRHPGRGATAPSSSSIRASARSLPSWCASIPFRAGRRSSAPAACSPSPTASVSKRMAPSWWQLELRGARPPRERRAVAGVERREPRGARRSRRRRLHRGSLRRGAGDRRVPRRRWCGSTL